MKALNIIGIVLLVFLAIFGLLSAIKIATGQLVFTPKMIVSIDINGGQETKEYEVDGPITVFGITDLSFFTKDQSHHEWITMGATIFVKGTTIYVKK